MWVKVLVTIPALFQGRNNSRGLLNAVVEMVGQAPRVSSGTKVINGTLLIC